MEWEVWEEEAYTLPTSEPRNSSRKACRGREYCARSHPNPMCWCDDVDITFNFKGKRGLTIELKLKMKVNGHK